MKARIFNHKVFITLILFLIIILFRINNNSLQEYNQSNDLKPIIIDKNRRVFGKGELRYNYGVPYLKLSGSNFEMGLQYGVLMREEIHSIYQKLNDYKEEFISNTSWYIRPFGNTYLDLKLKFMQNRIPKEYRRELQGLALGAGITYGEALFSALAPELFGFGCSTFLKRLGDRLIMARNFDISPDFLADYPIVIDFNPINNGNFKSFGIVGVLGVITGMNQEGLGVTLNAVKTAEVNKSDEIPILYKTRRILENSTNLKEVEGRLEDYNSDLGWEMIVGSAKEDNGVIYDLFGSELRKSPLNQRDSLLTTNFFLNQEMRHKYMEVSVAEHPNNIGRYENIEGNLRDNNVEKINDIINILADIDFYKYKDNLDFSMLTFTANKYSTLQTIIMDLTKREGYFANAKGYSAFAPFYKYGWSFADIELYREEDKQIRELAQSLGHKYNQLLKIYQNKQYQNLLQKIDITKNDISLVELDLLFKVWKENKDIVDENQLLEVIDFNLQRYRDFSLLYIMKGRILVYLGQISQGIKSLNQALDLASDYSAYKVKIYSYLAEGYFKLNNKEKASEYASKCINLIQKFAVGTLEEELSSQVDKYID
jgi:hypothetical protein